MASHELSDLKTDREVHTTAADYDVTPDTISRRQANFEEKGEATSPQNEVQDEAVIAKFGKKQQLKRRFKSLSSIGLTCGLMLTWEVILFTLQFGLSNGGPAGLIYGYLAAWTGAMLQALVLAEMASMIPLAGGPFNWVAILSPAWNKKFLSYLAGWLTVIAWQAFIAEVCFTCASLIQGIIILLHDDYVPKLWHATLLFYAIALMGLFINTYLGRLLPRIEALMLILYTLGFVGVLIPLVYLSPHVSAKEVFTTFQNTGGWSSMSLSFFVGWITSITSFVGNDGADHIAEEIQSAARVIPFSIWFSTLFNGVLGFGMMIAVLFSVQDLVAATESATGFPFMDIFVTALGSKTAGTALIIVITVVNLFSVSSCIATASRTLWAFSRENGLPFSNYLVKVDSKTRLPINALLTTVGVNFILALISIGSTAAFQAFYSVVLAAYYSSFLLAAGVMLRKRLVTPSSELPWGPFRLGRLGTPITIVAMCYTTIALFFSFWPNDAVVTPISMNWSCLLFGAALILSLAFWVIQGRKVYIGPIWEFERDFQRIN